MSLSKNALILHSTVTRWSTLVMDAALARSLGFDGLELSATKVANYLEAGYSEADLRDLLRGLEVPALGFVTDIERQGSLTKDLMREAEELFRLARLAGAEAVQAITGPLNVQAVVEHRDKRWTSHYAGLLGLPPDEQVTLTAHNLATLADLAKSYGLLIYLEALAWTPLNTLQRQLEVIERSNRDNLRIVIDFWHCYASGDGPDQVSRVPQELIHGVHVCDSLPFEGGTPDEGILRDVSTGDGVLNLQEWVDAVKATGYERWWSCELFCKRDQQGHSPTVAGKLKNTLQALIH